MRSLFGALILTCFLAISLVGKNLNAAISDAPASSSSASGTGDSALDSLRPTIQGDCSLSLDCQAPYDEAKKEIEAYSKAKQGYKVAGLVGSEGQSDLFAQNASALNGVAAHEGSLAEQMDKVAKKLEESYNKSMEEAARIRQEDQARAAKLEEKAKEIDSQKIKAQNIAEEHRKRAAEAKNYEGKNETLGAKLKEPRSETTTSSAESLGGQDTTPVAKATPAQPKGNVGKETPTATSDPIQDGKGSDTSIPKETLAKGSDPNGAENSVAPAGGKPNDSTLAKDGGSNVTNNSEVLSRPTADSDLPSDDTSAGAGTKMSKALFAGNDPSGGPANEVTKGSPMAGEAGTDGVPPATINEIKGNGIAGSDPNGNKETPGGAGGGRDVADSNAPKGGGKPADGGPANGAGGSYGNYTDSTNQNNTYSPQLKPQSGGLFSNFFQNLIKDDSEEDQFAALPPLQENISEGSFSESKAAPGKGKGKESGRSKLAENRIIQKSSQGDATEKEEIGETKPLPPTSSDGAFLPMAANENVDSSTASTATKAKANESSTGQVASLENSEESLVSENEDPKDRVEKQIPAKTLAPRKEVVAQLEPGKEENAAQAKPSMRDTLKNRLMKMIGMGGESKSEEKEEMTSNLSAEKPAPSTLSSRASSRQLASSSGSRVEEFSMSPQNTQRAVEKMLSEADAMGEILGIESKGLFQRVRSAHLRFTKKI